jgi:6-phosphogluconolactonase (cycloisomerase 2 family)
MKLVFMAFFALALIGLNSCTDLFKGGTGGLQVAFTPADTNGIATYKIHLEGPAGASRDRETTATAETFADLAAGVWSVSITALDDTQTILESGTNGATVKADQIQQVTVQLIRGIPTPTPLLPPVEETAQPSPTPVTLTVAYVANHNANSISACLVNPDTGKMTPINGSPFAAGSGPCAITVDPWGHFAYVACLALNGISQYSIDRTTGELDDMGGTLFETGNGPSSLVIDSSRKLYVTNSGSNNVSLFSIEESYSMVTELTGEGSPFSTGTCPMSIIIDPQGKYSYIVNRYSNNISAYSINAGTGALTELTAAGSPFATGSGPVFIAITPSGKFAYVTNDGSDNISAYSIDASTGALTELTSAGSPFSAGTQACGMVIDPLGKYAFVINYDTNNNLRTFTIDADTGALTALGSPMTAGDHPMSVSMDPSKTFLYVVNYYSDTVSGFRIDTETGALTSTGYLFTTGDGPAYIYFTHISNW